MVYCLSRTTSGMCDVTMVVQCYIDGVLKEVTPNGLIYPHLGIADLSDISNV